VIQGVINFDSAFVRGGCTFARCFLRCCEGPNRSFKFLQGSVKIQSNQHAWCPPRWNIHPTTAGTFCRHQMKFTVLYHEKPLSSGHLAVQTCYHGTGIQSTGLLPWKATKFKPTNDFFHPAHQTQ